MAIGKWRQARARRHTTAAICALQVLRSDTARVRRPGGDADVPLGQVQVGDEVLVRPGERVAGDGLVIEGGGEVDNRSSPAKACPWRARWVAHGCCWKQCSLCDFSLDPIGPYDAAKAETLVGRIQAIVAESR